MHSKIELVKHDMSDEPAFRSHALFRPSQQDEDDTREIYPAQNRKNAVPLRGKTTHGATDGARQTIEAGGGCLYRARLPLIRVRVRPIRKSLGSPPPRRGRWLPRKPRARIRFRGPNGVRKVIFAVLCKLRVHRHGVSRHRRPQPGLVVSRHCGVREGPIDGFRQRDVNRGGQGHFPRQQRCLYRGGKRRFDRGGGYAGGATYVSRVILDVVCARGGSEGDARLGLRPVRARRQSLRE